MFAPNINMQTSSAFVNFLIFCFGVPKKFKLTLIYAAMTLGASAVAQTKWDLPAAYPATNFDTENLMQFAADLDKATSGKLKIAVRANASRFKANEIERAVQGGRTQIG